MFSKGFFFHSALWLTVVITSLAVPCLAKTIDTYFYDMPVGPRQVREAVAKQQKRRSPSYGLYISFYNCKLKKGTIAEVARSAPEHLYLTKCRLSEQDLKDLSSVTSINELKLKELDLKDSDLSFLEKLPRISILEVHKIPAEGAFLSYLQNPKDFKTLDLADSNLSRPYVGSILRFVNLQTLDVTNTDTFAEDYRSLPKLQHLKWFRGSFEVEPDKWFGLLSQLPEYQGNLTGKSELWIQNCSLTDSALEYEFKSDRIKSLKLDGTLISDKGLSNISKMTNLFDLSLDSCPVTGEGFSAFHSPQKLQWLSLKDCHLTQLGLNSIAQLPGLTSLDLSFSKLPSSPSRLEPFSSSKLQNLGFSGNSVTISDLVNLQKIESLYSLSLDRTKLEPWMASELARFKKLYMLSLVGTKGLDLKFLQALQAPRDFTLQVYVWDSDISRADLLWARKSLKGINLVMYASHH